MSEPNPDPHLEIAHVLFIDIVGSSKLLTNEQGEVLRELNQAVRSTEQFRAAEASGKLIRLPTGGWNGARFLHQPGRTGSMCLGNQQSLERSPESCPAHGCSQRTGGPGS